MSGSSRCIYFYSIICNRIISSKKAAFLIFKWKNNWITTSFQPNSGRIFHHQMWHFCAKHTLSALTEIDAYRNQGKQIVVNDMSYQKLQVLKYWIVAISPSFPPFQSLVVSILAHMSRLCFSLSFSLSHTFSPQRQKSIDAISSIKSMLFGTIKNVMITGTFTSNYTAVSIDFVK